MADVVEVKIDANGQRLLRQLVEGLGTDKVYSAVLRAWRRRAVIAAAAVTKLIQSGQAGRRDARGRYARALRTRSGSLARSPVGRAGLHDGAPSWQIGIFGGPASVYAPVQELGTKGADPSSPIPTIVPKKAKSLAFPLPGGPAVTPAGVPRYPSPRQFPDPLRFVPIKKGNVVGGLATKEGTMAYLLLKKVDITPKRFLRSTFEKQVPLAVRDLTNALQALMVGGGPAPAGGGAA